MAYCHKHLNEDYCEECAKEKQMVMRDCNDCLYMFPTEKQQTRKGEAHICRKTNKIVKHNGRHPALPIPPFCPLIKPIQIDLGSS